MASLHHFGPRSVEREPSSPYPSSAAPNLDDVRDIIVRNRRERLERAITWWSLGIATVAFWYFVAQLVRGWLS
jgi:hypothetical protein